MLRGRRGTGDRGPVPGAVPDVAAPLVYDVETALLQYPRVVPNGSSPRSASQRTGLYVAPERDRRKRASGSSRGWMPWLAPASMAKLVHLAGAALSTQEIRSASGPKVSRQLRSLVCRAGR